MHPFFEKLLSLNSFDINDYAFLNNPLKFTKKIDTSSLTITLFLTISAEYIENIKDKINKLNNLQIEDYKLNFSVHYQTTETKKNSISSHKITNKATDGDVLIGIVFGGDRNSGFKQINRNKSNTIFFNIKKIDAETYYNGEFSENETESLIDDIKYGQIYEFNGYFSYNKANQSKIFKVTSFKKLDDYLKVSTDTINPPRTELHVHTKYSSMDGFISPKDFVDHAYKIGHNAVSITDHASVQGFHEIQLAVDNIRKNKSDFKAIYGAELYVIDPLKSPILNPDDRTLYNGKGYIIFDIETTSLSPEFGRIIEFSAIKLDKHLLVVKELSVLIKADEPLSSFTKGLTHITDELLEKEGLPLLPALTKIREFIQDETLVAHNAKFDYSYLSVLFEKHLNSQISNPIIDTLNLAKFIIKDPKLKFYSQKALAIYYQIPYSENHAHRAMYDTSILVDIFNKLLYNLEIFLRDNNLNIDASLIEIDKLFVAEENYTFSFPHHETVLIKNQNGVKPLFKLITAAHKTYFNKVPRVPRKLIEANRENILIGSSCYQGEIFDTALYGTKKELIKLMHYYDYIEIQSPQTYSHLIEFNKIASIDKITELLKYIIDTANSIKKMIVVSGDVHYINKEDKIIRNIFVNALLKQSAEEGSGSLHPLMNKKRVYEIPDQHFKLTEELLNEFSFLTKKEAIKYIVTNPNKIASMIDFIEPIPNKHIYAPKINDSYEKLSALVYETATKQYGEPLPELINSRIEEELSIIDKHDYSLIYYVSSILTHNFNDNGHFVGSRGSVGSSLVAYFSGISEVNPLPPHYYCPSCYNFEIINKSNIKSGIDLPLKNCPNCHNIMKSNGVNIPFETFLDSEGHKVPDIDLNFSSDLQAEAHNFIRNIFNAGENEHVFRAGTISAVKQQTTFGMVSHYFELQNLEVDDLKKNYLAQKCEGSKRTTGQHPGGLIVIPQENEIEDFTPVQYPGDNSEKSDTTHLTYEMLHNTLLKFDLLGHKDPQTLDFLEKRTGFSARNINLGDKEILSLFTSTKALNMQSQVPDWPIGTIAIPEFGTHFVKKMLLTLKPDTFARIVMISGLAHGTNVWENNAKDLVTDKNNPVSIDDIIACRDDIRSYLIEKGFDKDVAFDIMEITRKGNFSKKGVKYIEEMNQKLPPWYVDSCKKIKYLFPKAHAAAYVTMAIRVGWYKIKFPLHFYSSYFSIRVSRPLLDLYLAEPNVVLAKINALNNEKNKLTAIQKDELMDLETVLEMKYRGYNFLPPDINLSDSTEYIVDLNKKTLLCPFNSISGLGEVVASSIIEERNKNGAFKNLDDFMNRTKTNKNTIDQLKQYIEETEFEKQDDDLSSFFDFDN